MARRLDDVLDCIRQDFKRPILNLVDGVWTYYNGCKSYRDDLEFLYLGDITDPMTPHLDTELGGEDIQYLPSLDMLTGKEEQAGQNLTNLERAGYHIYILAYRIGVEDMLEKRERYIMFASRSYMTDDLPTDDYHRMKCELVKRSLNLLEKLYNE
jgi:hypothetical protein|nr:MAG TPA: hypothetical protein [Caudoviricetes sp.]